MDDALSISNFSISLRALHAGSPSIVDIEELGKLSMMFSTVNYDIINIMLC